jgi:hypothetical protein
MVLWHKAGGDLPGSVYPAGKVERACRQDLRRRHPGTPGFVRTSEPLSLSVSIAGLLFRPHTATQNGRRHLLAVRRPSDRDVLHTAQPPTVAKAILD